MKFVVGSLFALRAMKVVVELIRLLDIQPNVKELFAQINKNKIKMNREGW